MTDKRSEDFNFKKLQPFNIDKIKGLASFFNNEWSIDTSRQDTFPAHKDTLSYFLYKTNLDWSAGDKFIVEKKFNNDNLDLLLEPIIQDLEKIHSGTRGNVLFIKLLANSKIAKHTDSGDYLMLSRRHHIPIITSDNTTFGVGDEEVSMKQGECWEINNSRLHYVDNLSDIDRIHLLIDIMPNNIIGNNE